MLVERLRLFIRLTKQGLTYSKSIGVSYATTTEHWSFIRYYNYMRSHEGVG